MMNLHYLLYVVFFFASSAKVLGMDKSETVKLETEQQEFTAGETIVLKFSGTQDTSIFLYCSNSYGTTLLTPELINNRLHYTFPSHMVQKIGVVHWKLVADQHSLSGTIKIVPQKTPTTLETYIGPPSIEAGGKDYAMLVVIPTDALDNPLKKGIIVSMKNQFLENEITTEVVTNNLIAYKNIFSPQQSGRMLISSACLGLNSKEYDVNIVPAIPVDFKISAKRHHVYADGNQITTFETSVLKDAYENVVSDGSYVTFYITNEKGNILKTSGTTIKGVASAEMIHPDRETTWNVKAYVEGISESNTISLTYKKVIEKIPVVFSENNRIITIGPLQSFMKQRIPDGLQVKLTVAQNDKKSKEFIRESKDGYVHFELNPNIFSNGNYNIEITAAGITKTFQKKKLW